MSDKIDLKKTGKQFYNPSRREVEIIQIPSFQFLMIDGRGVEESEEFQNAIAALFSVSYKTRFLLKNQKGQEYVVMPLEGLWWAEDMDAFLKGTKEDWRWTLMIRQPDFITPDLIAEATDQSFKMKGNNSIRDLRFENYEEGWSAQMMHIGPFSGEHENIMRIHRRIEESGGAFTGLNQKHHEIYLSDFRKCAPEKLRTVLRQPFTPGE